MRLIDADAYKKLHQAECVGDCGCCSDLQSDCTCTLVDRVPTAEDAVIVVRCKDCAKHYVVNGRDMCARNAQGSGTHWIGLTATNPDAFCSRGEQKGVDG